MINLLYDNLATYNLPNAKGMASHDNLREFFKNQSYPYTCTLVTEAKKDKTYFFSICPEQYNTCLSLEDYNETRIVTQFTPEFLELLKNDEYSIYLTVFFPYEGFSLEHQNSVTIKFLNYLVTGMDIPKEKILFVYGDLKIRENIHTYFEKCILPKTNLLGLNIFEYIAERDSRTVNFQHPDSILKVDKSKRFFSLNAAARSHRMYMIGALESKGLLGNFHYSWLNRDKRKMTREQSLGLFKYYSVGEEYNEYLDGYVEVDRRTPVELDVSQKDINTRVNQIRNLTELYADSYATLLTETQIDEYEVNMLFLSEKTYKAIYNFHPFLMVGCPGTLEHLRGRGYETFPELFDESYDKIFTPAKRLNAIITEVEHFCYRDKEELDKIYYSDYFYDKVVHNWKTLLSEKGIQDFGALVNWLKNFDKYSK